MPLEPQYIALYLQSAITVMFLGSFIIGYYSLRVYQQGHAINTLKMVMDEYQEIVEEGTLHKYVHELEKWKEALIQSDFTPHNFYYNDLIYISRVGQFYDYVGLLVKQKLIKFELLFEVLPFPDKFWKDTQEFQDMMQSMTHFYFWQHFNDLRERYMVARSQASKPKKKQVVLKGHVDNRLLAGWKPSK